MECQRCIKDSYVELSDSFNEIGAVFRYSLKTVGNVLIVLEQLCLTCILLIGIVNILIVYDRLTLSPFSFVQSIVA